MKRKLSIFIDLTTDTDTKTDTETKRKLERKVNPKWVEHYRNPRHVSNSRKCRYCHPELDKCDIDVDYANFVKNVEFKEETFATRLNCLLQSEMRFRNKFQEKHFADLIRCKDLKKMILTRLTKRIQEYDQVHDGTQTPYLKHAVDVASHFCAVCCRGCLQTWYCIPRTGRLSNETVNKLAEFVLYFLRLMQQPKARVRTFMSEKECLDGCFYNFNEICTFE